MVVCKKPFKEHGCGQCMPCRIRVRGNWTLRMMLELRDHTHATFLTTTYDEKNYNPSLDPRDHTLFIKSLREKTDLPLRFKMVGEYGDDRGRPHLHYALYGYPHCPYLNFGSNNPSGKSCSCPTCDLVAKVWKKGKVDLAELTRESCQYIAGYVTKKMTRDKSDFQKAYLQGRHPEFSRQSNRPGIGAKYIDDIYLKVAAGMLTDEGDAYSALNVGRKLTYLPRYLKNRLSKHYGFTDDERKEVYAKVKAKEILQGLSIEEYESLSTEAVLALSETTIKEMDEARRVAKVRARQIEKRYEIKQSKGKKF